MEFIKKTFNNVFGKDTCEQHSQNDNLHISCGGNNNAEKILNTFEINEKVIISLWLTKINNKGKFS